MDDESPFAVAAISYSLSETMVVASKLRAYGIDPIIPDWHYISNDPALISALGGLRLWVRQEDLAEAVEIIGDAEPDRNYVNGRMCDSAFLRGLLGVLMCLLAVGPPPRRDISLHKSARPR